MELQRQHKVNYSILFDTETTGNVQNISECKIYEMAWMLFNDTGIIKKRKFLIKEAYDSGEIKTAWFYNKNIEQIAKYDPKNIKPWKEVRNLFLNDFLGASAIFAYNINFDIDVLNSTNMYYTNKKLILSELHEDSMNGKVFRPNKVKIIDIAHIAILLEFERQGTGGLIQKNQDTVSMYAEFCRKYNFVTEKGNNQTTAESIYNWFRYLELKDKMVVEPEEHNAPSDIVLEYNILQFIKLKYDKSIITNTIERSLNYNLDKRNKFNNLWRKVQL